MKKPKVENGEVIERFEKKFGFNLWKEVQGFARGENEPAEVKVGKGWINISNDVKQFIYYALNQQRKFIFEAWEDSIRMAWMDEDGKIASTKVLNKWLESTKKEFLTKLEEEK